MYALLRDVLKDSGKVGIRTRQHLAAIKSNGEEAREVVREVVARD